MVQATGECFTGQVVHGDTLYRRQTVALLLRHQFWLSPSRLTIDRVDLILFDHDNRLMEFTLTSIKDGVGRRIEARRPETAPYQDDWKL